MPEMCLGSCWAINHRQHLNRQKERPHRDGWMSNEGTVRGAIINKSGDEAAGAGGGNRIWGLKSEHWGQSQKLTGQVRGEADLKRHGVCKYRLWDGNPVLPHFKISKLLLCFPPCETAKCCSIHFSLKRSCFWFCFLLLIRTDQKTQDLTYFLQDIFMLSEVSIQILCLKYSLPKMLRDEVPYLVLKQNDSLRSWGVLNYPEEEECLFFTLTCPWDSAWRCFCGSERCRTLRGLCSRSPVDFTGIISGTMLWNHSQLSIPWKSQFKYACSQGRKFLCDGSFFQCFIALYKLPQKG